ncbi:glycosyltransferase family 1 protein, partial [candidate division KSB1 bacterium]|nr:glycosyltransferase family 1 protein [candidate division KSB1 bacterium]
MRIAYIAAGAAGMYCGSCLHDNTLAAALLKKGHEVALIPTYTPLRTDEANVAVNDIFYGGINVYLQEKFPLFRRTPWRFDRLLNNPTLL